MRRSWLWRPLALFFAGCASDEDHPPEYVPDATGSAPRTCGEVRTAEVTGTAIWIDGAPAGCGASGQECPVFDVATFAGICAQGIPVATCQTGKWVVLCRLDAGLPDGNSDAQAADASAD